MKEAIIKRHYGEFQTLGNFIGFDGIEKIFECKTLELPWLDNKRNVSCIHGKGKKYIAKVYDSPSKGKVYLLRDVENRTYIEIHIANYKRELLGCIAVGAKHCDIDRDGYKDVTSSGITLAKMFEVMGNEFELTIL